MEFSQILERLCLTPAPSGYEKECSMAYKELASPFVDSVMVDRVGNTICTIEGRDEKSPHVMVYAHLDTLGFIVRRIENDGFVQVDRLGGIPEKVLPGLQLSIRNSEGRYLPGVFGNKAHHAVSAEEKYKVEPVTSLYVDVGAKSKSEVEALGIHIGSPVIYRPQFTRLCGDRVCATALDDRGGLAAMIQAAFVLSTARPKSTVHFVGTVWEEFNIRGAVFAARFLKPDIAIGLDVILSGDTPDLKNRFDNAVGDGPTINYYSFHGRGTLNGTIPHEGLSKLAVNAALELGVPFQRFASLGIITESAYVQMEGSGIPCLDMGFPVRYTHTPVEVGSITDMQNLGFLLSAVISRIDSRFETSRY